MKFSRSGLNAGNINGRGTESVVVVDFIVEMQTVFYDEILRFHDATSFCCYFSGVIKHCSPSNFSLNLIERACYSLQK